jgi:hypothetical protein
MFLLLNNMKKNFKKIIFVLLSAFVFGMLARFALATDASLSYPEFTRASSPAEMIYRFYRYALSVAGALATIRVVWGGVLYMISAGNSSKQADARDIISSAVWGLLLLAGAYLVLNTINPEIVNLKNPDITPLSPQSTGGSSGGGYGGRGAPTGSTGKGGPMGGSELGSLREEEARNQLKNAGIGVKDICSSPGQVEGCAKLDGIKQSTIDELVALKKQCEEKFGNGNCNVYVNEGTGAKHSTSGLLTHANGYKADLNYEEGNALYNYITGNFQKVTGDDFTPEQKAMGYPKCYSYRCYRSPSGAIYMAEGNPPDHWDVTVPPPAKSG